MSVRSQALPRTRARLTARAGILAALVVIIGALSIVPAKQLLGQRATIAELEGQAERLQRANHELEERISRLHDPDELERLARVCLGMVKPGETAFVTVPRHGMSPPAPC
jgi:cell division protein FtsB